MKENAMFENMYAIVSPVSWAVCASKESIYYIIIIIEKLVCLDVRVFYIQ